VAPGDVATAVGVDAADFEFRPGTIEVAAGGQVTWTNRGVAPHSVMASDGTFDSGMLEAGATFQQTFETPGTYAYLCAFHPEMQASIRVVAATTGSGATAAPAAAGELSPTPAGAAAGQPAPTSAGEATFATAVASTTSSGVGGLAGIVLAVTFVSIAVALFAAAIRGTNRTVE
jgi:hypothetical protein